MGRTTRHLALACASTALIALIYWLIDATDSKYLFSMATAYTGLLLLSVTLIIGPLNLINGMKNPVSAYFRRDIGIWAAVISIVHMIIGVQVHMGGRFLEYFFYDGVVQLSAIRFDVFGLVNHVGLLATIICIVLMVLSNNRALQKLGTVKWKNIQRLNYLLFILVVAHGIVFQIIEKRHFPYAEIVGLAVIIVFWYQWRGFRLYINR